MGNTSIQRDIQVIASLQRDLNLVTAFLLLSGQITIVGVFVIPGGFSVSLSGPIFGGSRLEGKCGNRVLNAFIDIIDVIIAILLIIDEIRLVSVVVGPGRFSVDVSGPIFGEEVNEPTLPLLRQNYNFFHQIVSNHFNIDPTLFRKLEKE
ncbi:hypothetical protein [Cytobacillus dafuensis]|uniref:hypothetical protein n=1 Tax=Cytobacillus dafuensis TaxID=1742359 RepID=UPI00070CC9FF|nr:hypothetical protein [Cytobacillus dafuensis]